MGNPRTRYVNVADDFGMRRIACLREPGKGDERAGLLWLPGFKSDMVSTKASLLANWARDRGLAYTRFDYSGHGQSEGQFEDGTIGSWLAEAEAVRNELTREPLVIVGSSMGGWIALLLARAMALGIRDDHFPILGLVLIAPAWDMTETLMWNKFPDDIRKQILADGVWYRPSVYDDTPYAITRRLIEEGRNHLIDRHTTIDISCPVRIIHGMRDPDVPWQHSLKLVSLLASDNVRLNLLKDAEHRLSRQQDLDLLLRTIEPLLREPIA